MSRPLQRFLLSSSALLILFAATIGEARSQCVTPAETGAANHLNMLVLGDSILWGQGLRENQKSWYRVKCWLQNTTGRVVDVEVRAHSGALVERSPGQTQDYNSPNGEVNLPLPAISEQVDDAVRFYGDPSRVDVVLVDGCINDVDVRNLLNASVTPNLIRQRAQESCGAAMVRLLRKVTNAFPNAHAIVPGYYRIISQETEDNAFIRLLVKKLAGQTEGQKLTDKQRRERLIVNSEEFYSVSTTSLREAINQVNSELEARGSKQKILFAEIAFWPEHAFSAKDTLLWTFVFASTNLSGFRKLLVILTFGTSAYKPNDLVRKQRTDSCKLTYQKPKGIKETKAQKQNRENRYLACRYASLGHPNQMGALIYAEAIKGQLQWLMRTSGWLRSPRANTPTTPN